MKTLRERFLSGLGATITLVSIALAAPPEPAGGFTLVALPDTQVYSYKYPDTYLAQTGWVAANAARYGIRYAVHLGDVTQHNLPAEWELAAKAHLLLAGHVPWIGAPGNHDLGPNGKSGDRDSLYSKTFPLETMRAMPGFGGVYDREPDRTENSFCTFTAGGRKWLILALEFGPRDDVLRWAGEVADRHADHSVILVTHAYLRPDGTRFDRHESGPDEKHDQSRATPPNKGFDRYPLSQSPDGFNDGGDLWRKLVHPRANFVLVISGHDTVSSRLTGRGEHGNEVHQLMVDYQDQPNGGDGYLRLLQFLPDGGIL